MTDERLWTEASKAVATWCVARPWVTSFRVWLREATEERCAMVHVQIGRRHYTAGYAFSMTGLRHARGPEAVVTSVMDELGEQLLEATERMP